METDFQTAKHVINSNILQPQILTLDRTTNTTSHKPQHDFNTKTRKSASKNLKGWSNIMIQSYEGRIAGPYQAALPEFPDY
jgi:hypothetical protein